MTLKSSHFKKLLTDESVTTCNANLEEDLIEVDMPTVPTSRSPLPLPHVRRQQTTGPSTPLDVLKPQQKLYLESLPVYASLPRDLFKKFDETLFCLFNLTLSIGLMNIDSQTLSLWTLLYEHLTFDVILYMTTQ